MSEDIIIVGAGAAGLAAGMLLKQQGRRALILEARARVGGRAHTDREFFGMPVDLGCAWFHSADQNLWGRYASENGFDIIHRSPDWRRRIGRDEVSPEHSRAMQAAWDRNEELISKAAAAGRDVAVSELIPVDEWRPFWDAVMTWLMAVETPQVSSVDYDRYSNSETNWAVREGLGTIIAHATRNLEIRTSTPVETIKWSTDGVDVITAEGTLRCKAVIITAPTTVLANGGIRFDPELPVDTTEAFHGVPLGHDNKVFFQLQPDSLPFEGTTHFVGTDKTSRTGSYQVRPAGQELLLAYFGGDLASDLEKQGALDQFAREQLGQIFGSAFPNRIVRSLSSAWTTDRYSQGSYTAARPGCAHMREQLSVPVGERLFFAGEANSVEFYGTVHGAWMSAAAAVERILATIR